MKNLNELANECMNELNAIDIPYCKNVAFEVNTRSTKRWGMCKYRNGAYQIEISSRLLEDNVSDNGAKNTIIHELLHTCPNGGGHTKDWKMYANKVNTYYSYNIQRTSSAREKGVPEIKKSYVANYAVKCDKCGRVVTRQRKSDLIQHPENYIDTSDGGHFYRIK